MSQHQDLPDIDWSKLSGSILSGASYALTVANDWSNSNPYLAAGALLCISAKPNILLTPLRWTGKTTLFILYILGFRRRGVERDSFASRYQSQCYGGYVPRDSMFAEFQSYGATSDDNEKDGESTPALAISWLSGIGAVFVLGRTWGWWD
ncbi:hypothetical protein M405DRAFT_363568 [Rhizopogon salebrosus TDB-379]|nr:hypothetical protein M405DRAFT_363568 [Rhizopogon salebrosus TDB-379]